VKPFGATLAALVLTTKALPALAGEPMTLGDYMALSGPAPTARIAYGRAPQQYVELFEPAGRGPFPVAALIHGGCFYNKFEGMKQMRGMAGALTAHGVAVWSIEYRGLDTPGGGYPGTFRDVSAAIEMLASEAKSRRLDTRRLVVIGHSAGAYLGLWLAGRQRLPSPSPRRQPNPLPVRQVIALGGDGDLKAWAGRLKTVCGTDIAKLTGAPSAARPNVYADTSPAELIPNGGTSVFINGALDIVATPEESAEYAAKLRQNGAVATAIVVPSASHFDEPAVGSRAWPVVLAAILSAVGMARTSEMR